MYKNEGAKGQVDTFIKTSNTKIRKKFDFILHYIADERNQFKEMKISAVGIGEIELNADGSYTVVNAESNTLSPSLMPNTANAFKIDIGGSEPNTKITTVVILN